MTHLTISFQPESFGPVGVSDFLRANSVSIVVAAVGSACYQFFVDPACTYNILLILGDFNPRCRINTIQLFILSPVDIGFYIMILNHLIGMQVFMLLPQL